MLEDATLWATSATHASGTLRWLAPELMKGQLATGSMPGDVYAYAMTSYEIITDLVPFHECRNEAAVLMSVLLENAKPTKPQPPMIPKHVEELWGLWTKCWCTKPEERLEMKDVCRIMQRLSDKRVLLASASNDSLIRIWDARTGFCIKVLQHAPKSIVGSVAFSPHDGGRFLVSGAANKSSVFVWDVESGDRLGSLNINPPSSSPTSPSSDYTTTDGDPERTGIWSVIF